MSEDVSRLGRLKVRAARKRPPTLIPRRYPRVQRGRNPRAEHHRGLPYATHTHRRATRRSRCHATGLPKLSCAHSRYAPAVPQHDAPDGPPKILRRPSGLSRATREHRERHTRSDGHERPAARRGPVRRRAKPRNIRDGRRRH